MEKIEKCFFFYKKTKYFSQLVSGFVPYYKSLFLLVSLKEESEEMRLLVNGLSVRLFVCCFYGGRRNVIKKILRAGDDDDGDRNKI